MWNRASRRRAFAITVRPVLPIIMALAVGISSHAAESEWSLQLEPMYMRAYGHDQHVLTIRESQVGPPAAENKTAVNLETESGLAFRLELQNKRKQWGWGVDLFSFATSQKTASRTAAADGPAGPVDEIVFQVADREYTSTGPGEVLFYGILEDTDLEAWTVDLYGMRTLADKPQSGIHLQFGLRFGDFDNDYFAVVGEQDVDGTELGASSNYAVMAGPLVGLGGDVRVGRNHIKGYIGQSVLIGSAELSNMSTDFTGPVGTPSPVSQESFRKDQDVAIPITEFRLKWTYSVSKMVALGVGANTSVWWDVSVPPGVMPIEGGDGVLHENTIVFFGLVGAVELTF